MRGCGQAQEGRARIHALHGAAQATTSQPLGESESTLTAIPHRICAFETYAAAARHHSQSPAQQGTIDKDSAAGTPGKQFDSSRGRGKTFDFQLGAGRVIQGWDKGLEGLCVGAKAVLTIPPDMGYGALPSRRHRV